eukprot:c22093_g1_i1 orf=64-1500(+)
MECVLGGGQIKSFNRAINCLARIGSELLIEGLPEKLTLRTLNSSRSAFLAITFKGQFFDAYQLSVPVAQCSVLLKAVCTVFRTPPGNMEHLIISLSDMEASKLQWTLECLNGIRKTYWITCNHEPDMQHVVLDRKSFPSHLVVKPCDLNRLLANFQASLQEITLIATEPSTCPLASETSQEGKAVELRSYIDPTKENTDGALHTQLWIDPTEELQEYVHCGTAVDVTFSLKELKAFLAFCEGSEADIHMFFEKAGSPILLSPRYGLDDSDHADFDATLVLATMLGSQLRVGESYEQIPQAAAVSRPASQMNGLSSPGDAAPQTSARKWNGNDAPTPRSGEHSDHTRIWSEISGSVTKDSVARKAIEHLHVEGSADASEEIPIPVQRQQSWNQAMTSGKGHCLHASDCHPDQVRMHTPAMAYEPRGVSEFACPIEPGEVSKRNLSNWVSADTEDEDENDGGDDLFVQSTPPRRRGLSGV